MNDRDHDLLTRVDVNVSEIFRRLDDHLGRFESHMQEDKESFAKIDARTARIEKFVWMIGGAIILINALMIFIRR